jgi:hypothetical protein
MEFLRGLFSFYGRLDRAEYAITLGVYVLTISAFAWFFDPDNRTPIREVVSYGLIVLTFWILFRPRKTNARYRQAWLGEPRHLHTLCRHVDAICHDDLWRRTNGKCIRSTKAGMVCQCVSCAVRHCGLGALGLIGWRRKRKVVA